MAITMKIKLLFSTLIILLTSCSSNFVSTNIDKDNFSDYFAVSKVEIYQSEQDIKTHYQLVGIVEGQDCQIKAHHAAPDEINARTEARRKAYNQQANAIVFSKCALLPHEQLAQLNNSSDAQQCHAIVICYAKAYTIDKSKQK